MRLSDIQLLFDYNYWANQLMLTKAAELTPEQLTQPQPAGFSWGSLLGTLVHTMDSEHLWRHLCQSGRIMPRLPETHNFPTLESVADFWKDEENAMRAYLDGLTDMDSIVRYEADGNVRERVLWHCLAHLVNHGTQHRSECAAMLTNFGHSPGGIDFTLYMNKRGVGFKTQ